MTTTDNAPPQSTLAAPEIPLDWALLVDRVRSFAPEDDSALIEFIRGEAAGFVAYAEAVEQARDNCVNDVGLDPTAVAGFTAVSEHVSEGSERLTEELAVFFAAYGEVLRMAADGVVLPYKGRWFTGNTA